MNERERDDVKRGLHLLLGRAHLALAGVRPLTDIEWDLLESIDRWWQRKKR